VLQFLFLIGAWKRGWKARALIPIGVAIALVFIMAASGVPTDGRDPIIYIPDLVSTVALGIMCLVRPASAPAPTVAVTDETQPQPVQGLAHH
jgi:peptidoglycan/LPS O-acetylase OafA/YrhL